MGLGIGQLAQKRLFGEVFAKLVNGNPRGCFKILTRSRIDQLLALGIPPHTDELSDLFTELLVSSLAQETFWVYAMEITPSPYRVSLLVANGEAV